jgi:hypothetical protein
MKSKTIAIVVSGLALSLLGGISALNGDETKRADEKPSPPEDAKRTGLSDLMFARVKVVLPAPSHEPWKGPFFNSEDCLKPEMKETALRVLPGWIRQTISAGETESAARYLGTLFQLSEDADPKVAVEGRSPSRVAGR